MSAQSGYEASDARPGPLLVFGAALVALVALSLFLASRLDGAFERADQERRATHPMSAFRSGPDEPLLQAIPASELEAQRAEEERLLGSWGWVDRESNLARIPVARAMQILSERGLPAREPAQEPGER